MKAALACIVFPLGLLFAQTSSPAWCTFGLSGRSVFDLRTYGSKLYAATDTGVYVRALADGQASSAWTLVGLAGKDVRAVYPHDVGPLGYAVTSGLYRHFGDADSCVLYCSVGSDTAWAPADTGVDRSEMNIIEALDGFPDPRICGETYAGGAGRVYRRAIGGAWEKVFEIGPSVVNVIRTRLSPPIVMAGGETNIFAPYITRSLDKGDSWETSYPFVGGDNACNSLLFDPNDTLSVYAGMEGAIIRTTDGGENWISAGLSSTPYYFFGLAYAELYFYRLLFAVGATGSNEFGMFVENVGTDGWSPITPPWPLKGAHCVLSVAGPYPSVSLRLLIGTLGDGVVSFTDVYASVESSTMPSEIRLDQNYPNPFNASTVLTYQVPSRMQVRMVVYDALGRMVATLVEGEQGPGKHAVHFRGTSLPSGLYVCELQGGGASITRPMILLK